MIQQSYDQCDIYLCYTYIPPKDSSRNVVTDEDLFDLLYTDVIKYNAIGKVIIYGDMNARCGNLSDYIDYNFNDRDDLDDILFTREEHLFIQHLLSALYTNKHALMRYLINKYIYIYIYIHSDKYS